MIYYKNVLIVYNKINNIVCPWDAAVPANQTYYDNHYRRCTLCISYFIIILVCPANPSLYANFDTKRCVQYCPSGKYALDTTRSCTAICPTYYFINQTLTNI
jgi:hypothetical protein